MVTRAATRHGLTPCGQSAWRVSVGHDNFSVGHDLELVRRQAGRREEPSSGHPRLFGRRGSGGGSMARVGSAALVLKHHVVVRREADACAEDVLNAAALLEESIDDGCTRRHERRLDEVREDGHDGVEGRERVHGGSLVRDARGHLREDGEVEDERRCQQRILARVVHDDGVGAAHEDLRGVFIHCTLGVGHARHILDDDDMVGVLFGLVQQAVRSNHVVDDVGLGDLLGAERLRGREVLAVVVAQVVVRDNGCGLDASGDEEVDHDRLHLGLARLEIVAADHHVLLLGELDDSGYESVLRRAVDVNRTLEDRGDGEDRRGRHFRLVSLNRRHEVVSGVIDT
mmetsp:Transcript_81070/g.161163  ORF Transcript_81070/g.161163 Transcript_81070/m.161163 type:complete len:342 (-) Transcript_81070:781-1806(-)